MSIVITDPEAINRVTHEYETAEADLVAFVEENADLVAELKRLADLRNRALNQLEEVARDTKMTLGPVRKEKSIQKVDVSLAKRTLGEELFGQIGGRTKQSLELGIDLVRKAVKDGLVSEEKAALFIVETASFKKPGEYKIP